MDAHPNLTLRRADVADTDDFVALIDEASRWLASRGIRQWPHEIMASRVVPALRPSFGRGEVFLALDGRRLVGGFVLKAAPPSYREPNAANAAYLSKLVVTRSMAGQRVGRAILHHAEQLARDDGRDLMRLDCEDHNTRLCSYYEDLGYRATGVVDAHGMAVRLLEKRL